MLKKAEIWCGTIDDQVVVWFRRDEHHAVKKAPYGLKDFDATWLNRIFGAAVLVVNTESPEIYQPLVQSRIHELLEASGYEVHEFTDEEVLQTNREDSQRAARRLLEWGAASGLSVWPPREFQDTR